MTGYRLLFALLLPVLGYGQLGMPDSAHVNMYFPHFADGGAADQQWQTKFTFINPNSYSVLAILSLYNDAGSPLNMDFGSGATSMITFELPPRGSRTYRSRMLSTTMVTGWARAYATGPIQGIVAFRQILNGVAKVEITAEATLPSSEYYSAANALLGVAVANIYSTGTLSINVEAIDNDGNLQQTQGLTVPAQGHVSFNLLQRLSNLTPSFEGSIKISSNNPQEVFVAWTVNADGSAGTISSLPRGRGAALVSQWDRICLIYWSILNTYMQFPTTGPVFASEMVQLEISPQPRINALAAKGNTIQVNYALAELIGDSPGELAFIVAHEMGHIYQQRTGRLVWRPDDKEWDADYWGILIALLTGYDPYAAAGALAKLEVATNNAAFASPLWEDFLTPLNAHASFSTRIDNLYNSVSTICSLSAGTRNACSNYKSLVHPHFPTFTGSTPLGNSTVPVTGASQR